MTKSNAIMSAMVLGSLTLSPVVGWSQSSPAPSGPSGSGIEQGRPSGRASTDSMGRSSVNGQWSQEDVRSIQEALKGKGHNPGPIDGVIGPRTQQALRAFQRAQNIQTSGQLDSSTASALGVTLSSDSSSASSGSSGTSSVSGSSGRGTSGTDSPSSKSSSGSSGRAGAGTGTSSDSTKSSASKSESGSSETGESKGGSSKSGSSKSGTSSD